jgi:hypothetical protein
MICLGPWTKPRYRQLKDKKLREVATKAYKNLCKKLVASNQQFLKTLKSKEIAIDEGDRKEIQEKIERATSDLQDRIESAALDLCNEDQSEESAPSAYRWILDTKCTTEARKGLKGHLNLLLSNQLLLGDGLDRNVVFKDHFLLNCLDEGLPWAPWGPKDT